LLVALLVNTLTASIIEFLKNYISLLLSFILRYSLKLHSKFFIILNIISISYFVTMNKNTLANPLIIILKINDKTLLYIV